MLKHQKKLTQSALILLSLLSSGCTTFGWDSHKPVVVETKAVERQPLNIEVKPLSGLDSPQWYVVTAENQEVTFNKLIDSNQDPVLFSLDATGYQELAELFATLRNHIGYQKEIIKKYKEYYEPAKEPVKP